MSRTIRCKNYELTNNSSWDRWGKKTALCYTDREDNGAYYADYTYTWSDGTKHRPYIRYLETPVEMQGRDRYRRWRMMHGESHGRHHRSPGWWYRNNRMTENRSINKGEMNRWLQHGGEYEPMFEAEPRSCWWDWS